MEIADRPRRVGLALGGGVVRGFAHLGVLSVLVQEGIPIDVVSGASAGALIGAMYCAGLDAQTIREQALRMQWWHVARPVFPLHGLVTFSPLENWLSKQIGDLNIEDLKVPFAIVATDLIQGEPVTFRTGRVAPRVRASCSVPGLVEPAMLDGMMLCDGGVSDNLPVGAAQALGADFVIGVNLFDPFFRQPRHIFSTSFAAVETLVRRAGGGLHRCDVLISPDLVGRSYIRFSKRLDLIARGEAAARQMLPKIQAALAGEPLSRFEREQSPLEVVHS